MRCLVSALAGLAAVAAIAHTADAQTQRNKFSVVTRVGAVAPERSASIDVGGIVGVDTEYGINRYLGLSAAIDVSRANTHGADFLSRLRYGDPATGGGDTVYYQYNSQPVNTINLGLNAVGRLPLGRLTPFIMGGVGSYTQLLDVEVSGRAARNSDLSYLGGAGVNIRLSDRTGLQFDVRSVMLRNYDRAFLDPTRGRSPNNVFPEDFPSVPTAKKTAQNTVITLGFRYIPQS